MLNKLKENSALSRGIYAYLDRGIIATYGLFYIIYFAKLLPKNEFGVFVLVDGIRILGITFCDLAVGQALIHYGAGKTKKDFWDIVVNSFILKVALFILVSFVILLSTPVLPAIFGNNNLASPAKLIPLLILTNLLYNAPVQMLNAKEQIREIFYIDSGLLLIFFVGMDAAHKSHFITDAYSAMLFLIAVRLISSFIGYFFIRDTFINSTFKTDTKIIKDLYDYSKSSFTNSLGVFIFSKTDIFILGFMLNPTYVALYASAAVITNLFKLLNEPINMVVLPAVSKLFHGKQPNLNEKIGGIYKKTSMLAFALSLPISVLLLIYPQEIMSLLYGEKYLESVGLVGLFAVWGLILPFYRCGAIMFNGVGKPEINAKLVWFGALVNALLNFPLIYYFKTTGAALATIITALVLLFVYAFNLQSMFQLFTLRPVTLQGTAHEALITTGEIEDS